MLQQFFIKQMLAKQLANLPEEQRAKVLAAFEKNPDFFSKLAEAIQERVKKGETQMAAIMAVVTERKAELQELFKS